MASSQPPSIQEIKRAIVAAGLEIYRSRPDAVHIAERPRDNQILDAGISIRPLASGFEVRVVMRCQRSDFAREPAERLYERVRELAQPDLPARGYVEIESREQHMLDPGDKTKSLDTWYELVFSRTVPDLDAAVADAKHLLALQKFVSN